MLSEDELSPMLGSHETSEASLLWTSEDEKTYSTKKKSEKARLLQVQKFMERSLTLLTVDQILLWRAILVLRWKRTL